MHTPLIPGRPSFIQQPPPRIGTSVSSHITRHRFQSSLCSASGAARTRLSPSARVRPTMLFDTFLLKTSPRWITVEPASPAVLHEKVLFIDRNTLSADLRSRSECAALAEPDTQTIVYGLAGFLDTLYDSHLIIISKRQLAGDIMERPIWRVSKLEAVPVRGKQLLKKMASTLGLSKSDLTEEAMLRAMLTSAVSLHGYYFSHALDLTRSAQKRTDAAATEGGKCALPDFARADMRFVWNRFAAQKLVDIGAISWVVPLILGYVDVRRGLINGKAVQLALISRRCTDRPGLRFTARGSDVHGNCSNFVETEQVVSHGDAYSSYVQLRGSIPLLWKQEACLIYKPVPTLKNIDAGGKAGLCQAAFEKHFDSLFEHYGPVTAISLVDNRGGEAMLYGAYQAAVELMAHPKLHFVPWDFHQRTKGMKYEKVESDLLPSIEADLEAYSYFYSKDGTARAVTRRQRGVIRTNCIDSLDRTNVVQSVIAHRIMDASLKAMGVLDSNPETCTAAKFETFEREFKNTWADHANALSNFYAGSHALKTDYTRTGKRSKFGIAQDGARALRRYVYQNFLDGQRQDGIDILLGVVRMPKSDVEQDDVNNINERVSKMTRPTLSVIASKAEPLLVKEKFLPHLVFVSLAGAAAGAVFVKAMLAKSLVMGAAFAGFFLFAKLSLRAGHKLVTRPKLDGTH